jgi:hypothetical protein
MYDDLRRAQSPEDALRDFLQSTYEAGAILGKWDRAALERSAVVKESRSAEPMQAPESDPGYQHADTRMRGLH